MSDTDRDDSPTPVNPTDGGRRKNLGTRALLTAVGAGALLDSAFYLLLLLSSSATGVSWFVTAVVVANLLPPVLLGPVLGWLVDRTSGRWAWAAALAVSGLSCLGVAMVDDPVVVVALAGLQAVASVVINAAAFKLLPEARGLDERSASSFAVGVGSAAAIGGPPLAAIGASGFGNSGALVVLAGLAVIAALGVVVAAPRLIQAEVDATSWHEVWMGTKTVRTLSSVRAFAPVVLGIVLVTSMEGVAGVFYLQEVAQNSVVYAVILSAWAAGSLAGAVWTGRRETALGVRSSVLLGGLLMSVAILVEGLAPIAAVIAIVFIIGGLGNAVHNVGIRNLVYEQVPRAQQAQVWSMLAAVMSGTAALGNVLGTPGLIGSARTAVIVSGAAGVVAVAITAVLLMRAPRGARLD